MILGYARVSTDAQDLTSQLAQLKAVGCERVFREKISGATAERPQLKKLLATVGQGDVVIIPAVDRLSRDTTDLLVIARDLQKAGPANRLAQPLLRPLHPHSAARLTGAAVRIEFALTKIEALVPRPGTSKAAPGHKIYPYLP